MKSLDIFDCEIGTVSSRQDHSAKFTVITPELKISEVGELHQFHGRSCRVVIFPNTDGESEKLEITTERNQKTPSQRLRAVLWRCWEAKGKEGDFDSYYISRMDKICEYLKRVELE